MREDFLDQSNELALTMGDDGTIVRTKQDIDPSKFFPIIDAPISSDVYRVEDKVEEDINLIQPIGPNSVSKGVGDEPGTLGEAQIIQENTDTRLGDKRSTVEAFYGRAFRLIAQFIQQYWIEEDILRISGDGSNESDWMQFNPDEIQGEYAFEVDPESARDNSAIYRKQAQDALTTLTPLLAQGLTQIPGVAIMARQYLQTFESFRKSVDEIVPPPPSPEQIQGETEAESMLQDLIGSTDPNELIDKIQTLPENERNALEPLIQKMSMKGAQSPGTPSQAQGIPSNSNLIASASTIKL
jgi:hypothetical protein